MNIHAHDAATATFNEQGVRGSSRAFSRKIRAMREADPSSPDLAAPMEELQREEERRDS